LKVDMGYEFLDHTADIGLKVWADSIEGLFQEAGKSITSLMVNGKIDPTTSCPIQLQADSLEDLFHDWLAELNYLFLVKHRIFESFVFQNLTEKSLQCVGYGEFCDPKRHRAQTEIKAITYHQLYVQKQSNQWIAQVFFDL